MESFEHVTKIWLEAQGFAVSSGVKFPVRIKTRKKLRVESQTHGYEVDLVAARAESLVLVNVKSYFGSKGLNVAGLQKEKIFSDRTVLSGVVDGAMQRFGYRRQNITVFVVVGKMAPKIGPEVRAWLESFSRETRLPIKVFEVADIARGLLKAAASKTYFDDPVVATVKCLRAAGFIVETNR